MKRVALIVLCAGSALAMSGCDIFDPKVDSPISGKPVNEAGLAREIAAQQAKAQADAQAASEKAAREIREAQAAARRAAIDLQQKQSVTAAEIQATAARVEAETGQRVADAQASAAAALKGLTDRMALLDQQATDAYAAIDAKKQAYGGLVGLIANNPFTKSADAATGGAITGLLGLAGGWLGRSVGSRKRHDATWEEATAKAKADADALMAAKDAAWDQAQLALHQLQAPSIVKPVAPAAA